MRPVRPVRPEQLVWLRVAEAERSGTDVLPHKLVYNVSCSVAPVRQFIRSRRLQSAAASPETEDERSPAYMARSADDPDPPIEDGPGRTRSGIQFAIGPPASPKIHRVQPVGYILTRSLGNS